MKTLKITFEELENEGYASVTDLCRDLVDGVDFDNNMVIEVYRGEMLCLTVTDVKKAATLEPAVDRGGWRKYRPNKHGPEAVDEFK